MCRVQLGISTCFKLEYNNKIKISKNDINVFIAKTPIVPPSPPQTNHENKEV